VVAEIPAKPLAEEAPRFTRSQAACFCSGDLWPSHEWSSKDRRL